MEKYRIEIEDEHIVKQFSTYSEAFDFCNENQIPTDQIEEIDTFGNWLRYHRF